jgi:hypothetical protein
MIGARRPVAGAGVGGLLHRPSCSYELWSVDCSTRQDVQTETVCVRRRWGTGNINDAVTSHRKEDRGFWDIYQELFLFLWTYVLHTWPWPTAALLDRAFVSGLHAGPGSTEMRWGRLQGRAVLWRRRRRRTLSRTAGAETPGSMGCLRWREVARAKPMEQIYTS